MLIITASFESHLYISLPMPPFAPVPHHHWIHARKAHGVLSGDHLLKWDQTCQGLMKILSAVTKAMLALAKGYPKGIQISSFLCIQLLISHVSPLDLGKKQLLNESKFLVVVYHPLTHQSPPTKSHTCTSDLASVVKRMIRSSEVSKRNFKASCQRRFVWKVSKMIYPWRRSLL